MKKIVVMLAVIMFSATSLAGAEEKWDKWNVAPYAPNLLQACRKGSEAIDGFTLPSAVKDHFKKKLGAICKDSSEAWLTPSTRLEEMWSGGRKPHVMKGRIVGELPVLKSPDGRSYRKGSVAETAKALSWSFTYEGKTYILYLPFVCFNWSWGLAPPQSPIRTVAEQCLTVEYVIEPGDEVRFAVLAQKRLPASACWQLCDGMDCAAPPSPCDTCDWTGPKSVIPIGFEPLHSGRYVARDGKQSLRFPLDVQSEYVALCVTRKGAQSNSWVVQPSAWSAQKEIVSIPYGGQEWPSWGMDKIDWSKWPRSHD